MDRQRPASGWIRVTPAADTRALNNKIIGKEALYRDAITKFQTALISRQRIGLGLFTSDRSSGKPSPGGRPPLDRLTPGVPPVGRPIVQAACGLVRVACS